MKLGVGDFLGGLWQKSPAQRSKWLYWPCEATTQGSSPACKSGKTRVRYAFCLPYSLVGSIIEVLERAWT